MTCIVAVADGHRVVMGGDACASSGVDWFTVTNPKVFRVGEAIMGGCGSFRMLDILRFGFQPPKPKTRDLDLYMRTVFVDALRATFEKAGIKAKADGSHERISNGEFIVGMRGRLFTVQDDYSVVNPHERGISTGSGWIAAQASLVTTARLGWSPRRRVLKALEAAEACIANVRRPFVILESQRKSADRGTA